MKPDREDKKDFIIMLDNIVKELKLIRAEIHDMKKKFEEPWGGYE